MPTDPVWDDLLDLQDEIAIADEQYVYRCLGRINQLANDTALTLPAELRKPLISIMAHCQEAQRRLING